MILAHPSIPARVRERIRSLLGFLPRSFLLCFPPFARALGPGESIVADPHHPLPPSPPSSLPQHRRRDGVERLEQPWEGFVDMWEMHLVHLPVFQPFPRGYGRRLHGARERTCWGGRRARSREGGGGGEGRGSSGGGGEGGGGGGGEGDRESGHLFANYVN